MTTSGMNRENSTKEWLVVVNPNAGSRKGEKDWPKIRDILTKQGFNFKAVFTENRHHAIELTSQLITSGFRKLIVIGGDGTLNEVVLPTPTDTFTWARP